jgi:hypothetical protein
MQQIARNVNMQGVDVLQGCRYLLHDRDTKYTRSFRAIIESGQDARDTCPKPKPERSAERRTAILSIVIQSPRTEERLRRNPLGIYVNGLSWSKELGSTNGGKGS